MTEKPDTAIASLRALAVATTGSFPDLSSPDWGARFSWESQVDQVVRDVWDRLPEEARIVAYVDAWATADAQEPE